MGQGQFLRKRCLKQSILLLDVDVLHNMIGYGWVLFRSYSYSRELTSCYPTCEKDIRIPIRKMFV